MEPDRPELTLEALFARYRETRDPAALGALFDGAAPGLFRLALSLAPDAAQAEDALQETFLFALEEADRWDPARPVVPWLMTVLRFKVKEGRRREARAPDPARLDRAPAPDDPAALAESAEERERLYEAMRRLPEPYRGVALLRWRYGHEPAEIADIRGEPPGTVWSILHRAVKRLKVEMGALPALLLAFRPERGLDGVRRALLRRAAARAAAAAAGSAGTAAGLAAATTMGGLLMANKAVAAVAAVLLLGGAGWIALRPAAAPPQALPPAGTTSATPPPGPAVAPSETPRAGADAGDVIPPPVDLTKCDRDLDLFGTVVDGKDTPVAGARVETLRLPWARNGLVPRLLHEETDPGPATRSSVDGTFALRLRKAEVADLRVSLGGLVARLPGCIAGERVRVVLEEGATLALRALDDAGHPVPGARVRVSRFVPPRTVLFFGEGLTDAEGRCLLRGIPGGRSTVSLDHARLPSPRSTQEEFTPGAVVEKEVAFPAGRIVAGTVTDAATGKPIPDARVGAAWVLDRPVTTDGDGRYTFTGWVDGQSSEMHATAEGYGRNGVHVPPEGPVDFALAPGDRARGRILDARRAPLPGARLTAVATPFAGAERKQEIDTVSTVAGGDGKFELTGLRADLPHTLIASAPGSGRILLDFAPAVPGPGDIDLGDIVLPEGRILGGVVLDGAGKPMPAVPVGLEGSNGDRGRLLPPGHPPGQTAYGTRETLRTDDLGRFRFGDLAPGKYTVTASPPGVPDIARPATLAGIDLLDLELRIPSAGLVPLEVIVTNERGQAIPGIRVSVSGAGADGGGFDLDSDTDAFGLVSFSVPAAGYLSVMAVDLSRDRTMRYLQTGKALREEERGGKDGAPERVSLALPISATLKGRVLDPEGKPLAGQMVFARDPAGASQPTAAMTGAEGEFALEAPAGRAVDLSLPDSRSGDARSPFRGELKGVTPPAEGLTLQAHRLSENQTLTVIVLDEAGDPVTDASLIVLGGGGRPLSKFVDSAGRAAFEGLTADTVNVMLQRNSRIDPPHRAWVDSAVPSPLNVTPAGQEVVMRFRKGVEVRGRLLDENGDPLPRAGMVASMADFAAVWFATDDEGRFRFLAPEGVKVTRVASDRVLPGGATQTASVGELPAGGEEVVVRFPAPPK